MVATNQGGSFMGIAAARSTNTPRWMQRPFRLLHAAVLATLTCAPSAWAALGGDQASVRNDQQAWSASAQQSALAGATLHTQTLPDGVVVRQYVDASGSVFAVAWEGPVKPDFNRLLGVHFATYAAALRQQKRGVNVQSAEVVIESGGMMRAFSGRAFLPGNLPVTLAAQDIR